MYVRINSFTMGSIHLRCNPFADDDTAFGSIHLRSDQFMYVRINPLAFESIHVHSIQIIYVRISRLSEYLSDFFSDYCVLEDVFFDLIEAPLPNADLVPARWSLCRTLVRLNPAKYVVCAGARKLTVR